MSAEMRMRETLTVAFAPSRLEIVNESEMHAGHRSSPGTGESHFRILIVSDKFTGRSRVDRHRLVNEILGTGVEARRPRPRRFRHTRPERRSAASGH